VVAVSAPQARGLVVGAGVLAPASGGSPIATVLFRDDGVVPDARASDGVWTARVATPQSVGDDAVALVVRAAVHAGGEDGEASFDFVYTGARPAELTGTVAASLDAGSLAFDVGIAVRLPGRYVFVGRLDDARGRPIAVIRFSDDLDVGPRAVRLVAFGKLLRDEHAEAPFVLRDVEGFRLTGGGASDRQLVAPWSGPFVTARHSLSDFSDRAWDDPSKRAHLAALEGVVADLPPR